ncbi:protein bric-a-brac 2-like isoform X1 [Penaeus monodon]|uniref:protein bric-a-brac 2-like isoform X1 n=2 Tax=Penaeus monodon TaxID=6687 RepID=UPI0018A74F86|nr:protein bric-a-brac 2-like isoform X1 [Penaeus monodon]
MGSAMEDSSAMTANAQEFCLRWNNFHSSLVTALDGFKNDQDFVDVTLACEGQFLKAHKMLLSACSVFFRDLLKANPCQHPIVILPPEVRFADLEKLLRFIYQGEVNVHQENLARFLKTAEMLKIRGLAEDSEKQRVLRSSSPRPPEGGDSDSVSPKRPRLSIDVHQPSQEPQTPNDDSRLSGNDSDSEMIPVKQEMVELKDCSDTVYEGGDSEAFIPEAYLREGGSASSSQQSQQPAPPHAPPPPGPLLPSYVPPPQVKTQDDSPLGPSAPDELSQGTFARLVADHSGTAGGLHRSPGQGRSPVNTRSPGQMRSPGQGVSPSLNRSPASPSGLAGVRSKATLYTQQKSQQASVRSPITSGGCTTPSGRSPVAEGHSLTPSPLANIVPKLPVVVSGSSPTGGSCSSSSLASQSSVTLRLTTAPGVVPPLTCDICNKTFTSRSNLNKHKRVQHSGEEYVCPICRRTFRNRYYIKEHVLLCSTATQKKAAAAAASVVIGVPVSGAAMGMGLDEDDPLEAKVEEEEFDGLDDDQPTDLVLRRPASPT